MDPVLETVFGAGATRHAIEYLGPEINSPLSPPLCSHGFSEVDTNCEQGSQEGFTPYRGKRGRRKERVLLGQGGPTGGVHEQLDVSHDGDEDSEAKKLKMEEGGSGLVTEQGDISLNEEVSTGVTSEAPFLKPREGSEDV